MKCLLSVSLTAALAVVGELALSNLMQSPPLQKGVSVQMAVTSNAAAMPEADNKNAWIVAVTDDGKVYFGTDPVKLAGLEEAMKSRPRNRDQKLYVKADARVPFASVEKVLEAGREASFAAPILLTSQPERAAPGTIVPPKGLEVLVGPSAGSESPVVRALDSGQQGSMVEINNQRIPLTSLPNTLWQAFQNRENKVVLVTAGGSLPFADVVHVIDVCRGAGARVVLDTPEL
ncbi:MAG: biopolymer transporter ExbD [Candidatus Sulfotelmatobacter sp.]|jgi:biopolymer transport protein ExbD